MDSRTSSLLWNDTVNGWLEGTRFCFLDSFKIANIVYIILACRAHCLRYKWRSRGFRLVPGRHNIVLLLLLSIIIRTIISSLLLYPLRAVPFHIQIVSQHAVRTLGMATDGPRGYSLHNEIAIKKISLPPPPTRRDPNQFRTRMCSGPQIVGLNRLCRNFNGTIRPNM